MSTADNEKVVSRNFLIKQLRKQNNLEEINDSRGNPIVLNLTKRIVFDRPYVNQEYEKQRIRKMKKIMSQMQENKIVEKE